MRKKSSKRKNKKILMLTLIVILVLVLVILIIVLNKEKSSKSMLAYINSEEVNETDIAPKLIQAITSRYEGKLSYKAIAKSTYYFSKTLIPKYLANCTTDEKLEKYYSQNSKNIYIDIGIGKLSEFKLLINSVKEQLGENVDIENLKYVSSTFNMDEVDVELNNTNAKFYINYENAPQVKVSIQISNEVKDDVSSIKYAK